jgi:hypothetical protein
VRDQGTIEKVLQVGLGEQLGRIGKVVLFGLAFENCSSTQMLANMSGYVITAAAKKMAHAGQLGSKPIKQKQVVLALMLERRNG